MPEQDFDPDRLNQVHWFRISIPFEWIVKVWKKLFQKEESNEKD
jgi:hypothetical protein